MKYFYNILVCDDSKAIQSAITEMLKTSFLDNFEVITANNGREACTLTNKHKPDLIIMDIEMPVMNGIEAIRKIKSNANLNGIPIIVMSTSRLFHEAFDAGANDFLLKPVNQYELFFRVQLNIDLSKKTSEVIGKNIILENQKKALVIQRDTILRQKKDIIDDINYASLIQKAILPDNSLFNELCSSHFIYYKPKNIVSGDFYWITKKENLFIFALGDCTGHGLTGALLTIAGSAFLNEITENRKNIRADKILNDLSTKVVKLLHQKGEIGEINNGMDIALCVYNRITGELQFSGANNPIYITHANNTFDIIKADRKPIGFSPDHKKTFTLNKLSIKKGDTIYMFSDGYIDQFGGAKGTKFKYNKFRELLFDCSSLPMEKQVEMIETTICKWSGNNEQVDDMLILGMKF
jgi:serine phosphatase RsbU (regulator of sigma subunit)